MPITKGEFEGGGKPDPSVRVVTFLKAHRDEAFTLTEIYSALAEEGEEIDFDTIDAGLRLAVQNDVISLSIMEDKVYYIYSHSLGLRP